MKNDRISRFDMAVCASERHKTEFAVIAPAEMKDEDPTDITLKINAFIDFHLAIKPNVPVVLFDINNIDEAGTPVYNIDLDGGALYHLPESTYPYLDEFVKDTPFLVSKELLTNVLENNKVNASIFDALTDVRAQHGLVVLGMHK